MKEKLRNFRWKKTTIFLFCMLISTLLVVSGAFSWFFATDSKTNTFISSQKDFKIDVVDIFQPPTTPTNPGDVVEKTVGAKNNGSLPGFVRLMILPTIIAKDGKTPLAANIGSEIFLDIDTLNWKYGDDGYFYYLDVLNPGEEAESLFTKVILASDLGMEYTNSTLKIEVKCEAVGVRKWEYRESFWGSQSAPGGALKQIDDIWMTFAV